MKLSGEDKVSNVKRESARASSNSKGILSSATPITVSKKGKTQRNANSDAKVQLITVLGKVKQCCNELANNQHPSDDPVLLHRQLEKSRANYVKEALNADDHVDEKLQGWKFRVLILKEIVKAPFNYILRAGERVRTHDSPLINLPALDGCISEEHRADLIDAMVDIDTSIWVSKGVIHDIGEGISKNGKNNRTAFRSARRQLWSTAANALQKERQHAIDDVASPLTSGHKKNKKKGWSYVTGSTRQIRKWQDEFKTTKEKLETTSFLLKDYVSPRRVTDCPVLMRAQMEKGRKFISSNRNPTCTAVGLFKAKHEAYVTKLSTENERTLTSYIQYLKMIESTSQHYLGPHFCHFHPEGAGYTLHLSTDCRAGHFFLYQGECRFEGDRLDVIRQDHIHPDNAADDHFTVIEHGEQDFEDTGSCFIDPTAFSNFGRFAGGVSPKRLDAANCIAYTVVADGHYQILIVVIKDCKAGEALQYYYRGLTGEEKYTKIPLVEPPLTALHNL